MRKLWEHVALKWGTFVYNFGWANYVEWLDGRIPRFSFAIPAIGYLILFNDRILKDLTFLELTSGHSSFSLSGDVRVKFIYLGLILLGFANIVFRWRRPHVLRNAHDRVSYVDFGLKNYTVYEFIDLNDAISSGGRGAFTRYGGYYDSEWQVFLDSALGEYKQGIRSRHDPKVAHWINAKLKYEGLLRCILIETFFRESTQTRRGWLILCLFVSSLGYVLLAIPSLDLFLQVMSAIVSPYINAYIR